MLTLSYSIWIWIELLAGLQLLSFGAILLLLYNMSRTRKEIRMIHMRMRTAQPGIFGPYRWPEPRQPSETENKMRGQHPELWQWEPSQERPGQ